MFTFHSSRTLASKIKKQTIQQDNSSAFFFFLEYDKHTKTFPRSMCEMRPDLMTLTLLYLIS